MKIIRKKLSVQGIVQGVGFRPFIYRLAQSLDLSGYIFNHARGVEIQIQGNKNHVMTFLDQIKSSPPVLSHITTLVDEIIPIVEEDGFFIRESRNQNQSLTFVSPDIAICDDCQKELLDPENRRGGYPFINCTNCGPRYSIIQSMPYDRPNTSMATFEMCPQCQDEYSNPNDRRFHAQPVACAVCGPSVYLIDNAGHVIESSDPINKTVELIKTGYIIAIKGLGGFHLACDAASDSPVKTLRERKHREEKPLALMVKNSQIAERYAFLSDKEKELLQSAVSPVVLLKKKKNSKISHYVEFNHITYGMMLPYTPLHVLLFQQNLDALVMTSGNLSDEAIVIDNDSAVKQLEGIADYFLMHNRDIFARCDDSVMRIAHNQPRTIRRARGLAPLPVEIPKLNQEILALGGSYKNTICFVKKNQAFLSPHIGNLETLESIEFFERSIHHLKQLFDFKPQVIACDMHPDYFSTQWAGKQKDLTVIPIQHHEAHIASCLAENHVNDQVIGLAMDGTGYGHDGQIWGGEVFIGNLRSLTRIGHLDYIPLVGGDQMIREPWKMAIAYLFVYFHDQFESSNRFMNWVVNYPGFSKVKPDMISVFIRQLQQSDHVHTSSLGRLFDAVSAFLGISPYASFDGQPAMLLESVLDLDSDFNLNWDEAYAFEIQTKNNRLIIKSQDLWKTLLSDVEKNVPVAEISLRFHMAVVLMFKNICLETSKQHHLHQVALSGGCFQNQFLLEQTICLLEQEHFTIYTHSKIPCNDGGLALGQAVLALSAENQSVNFS